jgi:hypothetical protein
MVNRISNTSYHLQYLSCGVAPVDMSSVQNPTWLHALRKFFWVCRWGCRKWECANYAKTKRMVSKKCKITPLGKVLQYDTNFPLKFYRLLSVYHTFASINVSQLMARKKLGQISQRSGRGNNIEIRHWIRRDHGKIRQRSFTKIIRRQKLGGYQAEIRQYCRKRYIHHDHAKAG